MWLDYGVIHNFSTSYQQLIHRPGKPAGLAGVLLDIIPAN